MKREDLSKENSRGSSKEQQHRSTERFIAKVRRWSLEKFSEVDILPADAIYWKSGTLGWARSPCGLAGTQLFVCLPELRASVSCCPCAASPHTKNWLEGQCGLIRDPAAKFQERLANATV